MPLQRKEFWYRMEFQDFIIERKKMPFAWGSNDCALFAADAVKAITGTDIAADFRGKYSDEAGAFALIKSVTGKGEDPATAVADAAAWCAEKAGLSEFKFPKMAQRGDLVVIEDSGRLIAGVVHATGTLIVTVGEAGLKSFSISDVKRAWRV